MKLRNLLAYGLPALGLLVVGYYVAQVGLGRLVDAASTMGWWLAALLLAPLFQFVVHAIGWGLTLSRDNLRKLGWLRLSVLQTFAFGLSGIVPMYVMVSEPMKLAFLRGTDVDKEDFAASLLVDNTVNGIAILMVAVGGLAYAALSFTGELWITVLILGLTALAVAGFAALIVVQKRGLFSAVLNLLGRIRPLSAFRDRHIERTGRIDTHVRRFYAGSRARFFLVLFLHILEKAQGVFEFWVIFHALGMDVSWGDCFFIYAVANTLDNVLFFAQVGGMEAWVSSTLAWMGIARDSINITAALFRRARALFWALIALLMIRPTRWLLLRERRYSTSTGEAPISS